MGNFFRRSRAANSAVLGRIRPNFNLIPDFILFFFLGGGGCRAVIDIGDIDVSIKMSCDIDIDIENVDIDILELGVPLLWSWPV